MRPPQSRCRLSYALLVMALLNTAFVRSQSDKVSPKLDFDEAAKNNENSSVPIVPGTGGHHGQSGPGGTESTTSSYSGGSSRTGPKIHGVRVTVDTGDSHKSKESKESVEITDVGKHKKRVGIHTDITFEITANGEDGDGNATSSAQQGDKEDASVPIFKGRGGDSHKPRKTYDSKSHWSPNFSAERRGYEYSGRASPPYAGYYPSYQANVPVYAGTGDSRTSDGSSYRRSDSWNSYVPRVWTTERPYYRPNTVNGYQAPSWKPCYCMSTGDGRSRRDSRQGGAVLHPTSTVIEVVDGKLERPFSRK